MTDQRKLELELCVGSQPYSVTLELLDAVKEVELECERLREALEWLMSNGGDIVLHQGKYAYYNPQRKGQWCSTKLEALQSAKQALAANKVK
jgi:hypothetical protein